MNLNSIGVNYNNYQNNDFNTLNSPGVIMPRKTLYDHLPIVLFAINVLIVVPAGYWLSSYQAKLQRIETEQQSFRDYVLETYRTGSEHDNDVQRIKTRMDVLEERIYAISKKP